MHMESCMVFESADNGYDMENRRTFGLNYLEVAEAYVCKAIELGYQQT